MSESVHPYQTISSVNQNIFPSIPLLNPGTSLTISKSGNNVVFNWSGTGSVYEGTGSIDKKFLNEYLLFQSLPSSTFTYTNALINTKDIEFFDVTDETETNRGMDGNGQLPPPPPQVSTISASLYIGGTAVINGSNFSEVAEDNNICFGGGICIHPDTATTSQLNFIVPPSAVSGPLWVNIGLLDSNTSEVDILLEDPANAWTTRTIGYAKTTGEYWSGGNLGGNKFFRIYYDSTQKKWLKEDRSGSYTGNILYCSTKSSRTNRIYCGLATIGTGVGGTRYAQTNPPSNLTNCINLGGSGYNTNVRGAAADPNPDAIPARDVVYFAHANTDLNEYIIKKVSADCSTVLDNNYGNVNWYPNWNTIVGMAVDASNGDLYVAELTQIKIVHPDESVEIFKTGFSSIYGIDVWREPGLSSGYVVVADNGASQIKAISLDNPSAAPIVVASASIARAVAFGWTTYSTWDWNATSDLIRLIIIHNDGNTVPKLREEPFLIAEPYDRTNKIWISSPDPSDLAEHQSRLRPSDPASMVYSTVKIAAYWKDGYGSRTICAIMGDPRSSAPYETPPAPIPIGCTHPWKDPVSGIVYGLCDNHENFVVGGVGSPPDGATDLLSCKSNCGTNKANACIFEFQITQRYAGDNYRVYFWIPNNPWSIKSATITAWKRIHIEQDKMCRRGGMLWEDPGQEPDARPNDQAILIAKYNGIRVDELQLNDIIDIFDADRPIEGYFHDRACVIGIDDTSSTDFVVITLGQVSGDTCTGNNYSLLQGYDGSVPNILNPSDNKWDFAIGKSAGVCVPAQGYYMADTSQLNKRNKTGTFDDAFVSFKIFKNGTQGSGIIPYLPKQWFDAAAEQPSYFARFSQMWFKNFIADAGNPPTAKPHNYFHIIGASRRENVLGFSNSYCDYYYCLVREIELYSQCQANPSICLYDNASHEISHLFKTNKCTNLVDCDNPGLLHGKHDYREWWRYGGVVCPLPANPHPCLMNPYMQINEPDRLCKEDLLLGDPNCPPGNPKEGAIRTNQDPE